MCLGRAMPLGCDCSLSVLITQSRASRAPKHSQVLSAPPLGFNPISNHPDVRCPQILNDYNGEEGGIRKSGQQEGKIKAESDHSDPAAEFQGDDVVFSY